MFQSFECGDYTHKQSRLIQLKKGSGRFQLYGMGFSTCGSSIELFLWEGAPE